MDTCMVIGVIANAVACFGTPICHIEDNKNLCWTPPVTCGPPMATYECVKPDGTKYTFEGPFDPLSAPTVQHNPS